MPLDRTTVDRRAGRQIADLQQTRYVSDDEKRRIRQIHEAAAERAARKAAAR